MSFQGDGTTTVTSRITGGVIQIGANAKVRIAGSTLDGVSLNGDFTIGGNGGVRVLNGLTLNGTATLGDADGYGVLDFDSTQTLTGTGTIRFGSANANNTLLVNNDGVTLTIGPNIIITAKAERLATMPPLEEIAMSR